MPPTPPSKSPLWLQALCVLLLTWAGVALLFGRTGWADWGQPNWLEGDPIEVYARVQIAAEQPAHALTSFTRIDRLGAPGAADWSAYPVPDRLVFVLTGQLARATGLIAAVHLAGALIAGLNAVAFFLCARWLRCRWEWAAALSLVFAFSAYNLRWGITLSLNQVFVLPPLVLLCARAARRGAAVRPTRGWVLLGAGLGLWLGLANPYLAFFAGVVAGGALLLSLARRSPGPRRIPLLVFLGCLVASFGVANAGALAALLRGSTGQSLVRGAGDLRVYALRPADWVVPPADHRIPALAGLGRGYQAARHNQGEFYYNYLGLAGLAGLAAWLARGFRCLRQRRWAQFDPQLGLLWILAFAVAGGINTWLGTAGLDLFRAGTRIGIYLVVWVLLFLAGGLSRATRAWPRTVSVPLALLFAVAAVWEQTPFLADRTALARNAARWSALTELTDRLEHEAPAPAQVFQLPVVPFPEAGVTGTMTDYEHLLPLLTSRTLHFSAGQLRPSPALRWQRYVSRLPAGDFIRALQQAGFAWLWLDRRAYPDNGDALVHAWQALGLEEVPVPAALPALRVFRLKPAVPATPPDLADPRLNEPWDPAAGGPASLLAISGWYQPEREAGNRWRWAARSAVLGVWHEGPAGPGTLRFRVGGPGGAQVVVRRQDREVWRGPAGTAEVVLPLTLAPGLNTLHWELSGRTFRPGGNDPRELGFMVENLSLSVP